MGSVRARVGALILVAIATIVACGPSTTPSAPAGSPSPSSSVPAGAAVVTFRVADAEEFKVLVTDPANVTLAREILAGTRDPLNPVGTIVYGDPGVNTGYSWHLDPGTFEFAEVSAEVCDGRPSDVEAHAITDIRYCPWGPAVVAVDG